MKLKKKTVKKIIIFAVIILILAALGTWIAFGLAAAQKINENQIEKTIAIKDKIELSIEASGVIEPLERYEIVSMAKGEVIQCDYNEGDSVEKDALLYKIDDSDVHIEIEKTQNSMKKSELNSSKTDENLRKLVVYAPQSGTLTNFEVKMGDQINAQKIGEVVDNNNLRVKIPFNNADFDKIDIGDSVDVTSAQYMTSISGTVSYKYPTSMGSAEGSQLNNVEITITNPGALAGANISVGANVYTSSGTVTSAGSGEIQVGETLNIIPEMSGRVLAVYVKDGQIVTKGQKILELDGSDIYKSQDENRLSKKDLELQLESTMKKLDDYNIKSPISGVVITKTAKVGDKVNTSTSREVLMVVADVSKMIFKIDVDEMDISKVKLGQSVVVDADALPGITFDGEITKIANEGTSANGVTTYQVEITIAQPGELKPGMNVNGNIVIEKREDVVVIPESYVTKMNDDTGRVFVKIDENNPDKGMGDGAEGSQGGDGQRRMVGPGGQNPEGEQPPQGMQGSESNADGQNVQMGQAAQGGQIPQGAQGAQKIQIPDGYRMKIVKLGLSDGTNVEIIDGLSEGDEIARIITVRNTVMTNMSGGGMGGGGMGGAPMGGGGNVQVRRIN